eukprot:TRINITY_DN7674_c0_g2_i20.p1 TRINITY_DN7674_c0_g2~~TRINITY_DN7674_c0_g2_i20.p1  ORF type:complete len:318 (-),score=64.12 TRINITY_DN7674_c0_g2_i20:177-1130(-)
MYLNCFRIFVVRVTIAPKAVEINGGLVIDPNHVKLDFEFHEYPFRRHNTRLVLWARITSQIQIQDNQNNVNDDGGGFVFGNSSVLPFGTFTWVPTANVSGSDIPIVAWTKDKQYDQDNRHDIYFTFLTPEDNLHPPWITWDPKVGLGWNSAKSFWKQWYQRRVRDHNVSTMFLLFFYLFVVLAQPSQREIQIQVNQQQIHIQASYQNGSSSDQFQFNAELDQGMNILNTLFQYQEQSETSQKQFQFSLQIMQVLEVDISSSPVYRGDSSTIVWVISPHGWVLFLLAICPFPNFCHSSDALSIFSISPVDHITVDGGP